MWLIMRTLKNPSPNPCLPAGRRQQEIQSPLQIADLQGATIGVCGATRNKTQQLLEEIEKDELHIEFFM